MLRRTFGKLLGLPLIVLFCFACFFYLVKIQTKPTSHSARSSGYRSEEDLNSELLKLSDGDGNRKIRWKLLEEKLQLQIKAKRLPDVIGIGAAKCGTHALIQFLGYHPMLRYPKKIEMHFFTTSKDVRKYLYNLPAVEKSAFLMEKTPAYFDYPPFTIPETIKKSVPGVKLLLILCDPVKRTLSDFYQAWAMYNAGLTISNRITKYQTLEDFLPDYLPMIQEEFADFSKWDNKTFDNKERKTQRLLGITSVMSSILTTGLYSLHLRRWMKYFDESNLMIINGEDFFSHPGPIIEEVQDFVGMPKLLLKNDFVNENGFYCFRHFRNGTDLQCLSKAKQRTRNNKVKMPNSTRELLSAFYKPYNEALYKMLGKNFKW